MNSAIYKGKVRHRRFSPKEHKFKYRLFLNWIDLDEVNEIFKFPPFLGKGQFPSIISFRRKNYLNSKVQDLREAVLDLLQKDLGFRPEGKVYILTTLQYFGYCFNPVSFYYAYDLEGNLQAVAAEINNTPWNQRFSYCLDLRETHKKEFEKEFHVSPFMPMDMNYKWYFPPPSEGLCVHMQNYKEGELKFDATLKLKREPYSFRAMLKAATIFPLMPFKVSLGIYIHALILWLKKIPFYEHPQCTDKQKEYSHE